MPENWKPGEPIMVADPNDPTKLMELPQDAIDVVAEVNNFQENKIPDIRSAPQESSELRASPPLGKKGKKKKKKKVQKMNEEEDGLLKDLEDLN